MKQKAKTVVAGALGECVHVAGVTNFLRLAEAAERVIQKVGHRLRRQGKRKRRHAAIADHTIVFQAYDLDEKLFQNDAVSSHEK